MKRPLTIDLRGINAATLDVAVKSVLSVLASGEPTSYSIQILPRTKEGQGVRILIPELPEKKVVALQKLSVPATVQAKVSNMR